MDNDNKKRGRPRKERPEKLEREKRNNGWITVKDSELKPTAKVTVIVPKSNLRLFIDLIEINGLGDKVKKRIKIPVLDWEREITFKKYEQLGRNPSWEA